MHMLIDIILPRNMEMEQLRRMNMSTLDLLLHPVREKPPKYVTVLYSYKDIRVKNMVWHMKFKECMWVAEIFGKIMAGRISGENFSSKTLLLPVPIHSKRRRERGYNQCEWLCEHIMKHITNSARTHIIYSPKIVTRAVYTVKQSWSDKKDRQENIRGVFTISDLSRIVGADVLIIDDVCTTGATLDEMRRTLLEAGAFSVKAYVIAH